MPINFTARWREGFIAILAVIMRRQPLSGAKLGLQQRLGVERPRGDAEGDTSERWRRSRAAK